MFILTVALNILNISVRYPIHPVKAGCAVYIAFPKDLLSLTQSNNWDKLIVKTHH